MDSKTLWITRLTWLAIGLAIAVVITLGIYLGDRYGVWDKLWEWSGLWRYLPSAVETLEPLTMPAGTNLLVNPSFEGTYTEWGVGEVKIAQGWQPWYSDGLKEIPGIEGGSASTVPTARPEYRAATLAIDPYRVLDGEQSQLWFSFYKTNYAGIFQQVVATKGKTYQFGVWAQSWSSNDDGNPHTSPGELYISVGIDPDGGTWWKSRAIAWTQWSRVTNVFQEFVSLPITANKDKVTVWVASGEKFSLKHGDNYVDRAVMVEVPSGLEPCPTPEPGTICICNCEINYDKIKELISDRPPIRWPR